MILFIGASEVIFILFVVLLLFGAKSIPQVAKTIGKGYREFQKAANDIKKEFSEISKDEGVPHSKNTDEPHTIEPKLSENQ